MSCDLAQALHFYNANKFNDLSAVVQCSSDNMICFFLRLDGPRRSLVVRDICWPTVVGIIGADWTSTKNAPPSWPLHKDMLNCCVSFHLRLPGPGLVLAGDRLRVKMMIGR